MHICPGCNRELDDPDYVQPERADPLLGSMPWQNRLGDEHAVLEPVCPCGKRMRNWIIGEYRVLSPVVSSLRGIALGLCVIAIAAVIDEGRRRQGSDFAAAVPLAIAGFAACGAYALWTGLLWAGQAGPINRLAPRAYGVAAGLLVPAAIYALAARAGWLTDLSILDPFIQWIPRS